MEFIIEGISSIEHEVTMDNQSATLLFDKKKKRLHEELESNDNPTIELKHRLVELYKDLNDISEELPPYDLKRYSVEIEVMLKLINSKLHDGPPKPKRFQLKNRSKKVESTKVDDINNELTISAVPKRVKIGEDFFVSDKISSWEQLSKCTVTTSVHENIHDTGSISFKELFNSVINLKDVVFNNGSIFITDCEDCVILLKVPSNDTIQIRLHNLKNCKIYIQQYYKGLINQTVIIEGCKGCIFNKQSEDHITIQNFNDLGFKKGIQKPESYRYESFSNEDWETARLREVYIF